jgi:hypothetical protein
MVDDLQVERATTAPSKNHSPLIVDPYRVKPLQDAFQAVEPITGW